MTRRPSASDAASGSPGRLAECPQLALLRVDGSLFFGAVDHVQDELEAMRRGASARAHVLLIGNGINFIDVAGAELLAQEADAQRAAGGTPPATPRARGPRSRRSRRGRRTA